MDIVHRCCAGLDVHQDQVTACVRLSREGQKAQAFSREFSTLPSGLAALRDWLREHGVTHAAMEGTGVYWVPVYEALRSPDLDLTLCNAHHVRKVPGRKTDQSDAAWLAQLMSCGLLNKSFVPTPELRALRELTRTRVHRIEDRTRVVNGIHRLIERAGLKLCSILSDLMGMTGLLILTDLAAGVRDPAELASNARGSLRAKRLQLKAVLATPLTPTEQLLLGQQLAMSKLINEQIATLDEQIAAAVQPYSAQMTILLSVYGIDVVAASAILAEIGPDMNVFKGSKGIAAWSGLAPGQNESAGKRKRAPTRPGNPYLSRILVQIAMVIGRCKKPNDLTDFFRKKMPVLGYKKAAVATARKLLVRLWRMLTNGEIYAPPPPRPLTDKQCDRQAKRHIQRLIDLGYEVSCERKAA